MTFRTTQTPNAPSLLCLVLFLRSLRCPTHNARRSNAPNSLHTHGVNSLSLSLSFSLRFDTAPAAYSLARTMQPSGRRSQPAPTPYVADDEMSPSREPSNARLWHRDTTLCSHMFICLAAPHAKPRRGADSSLLLTAACSPLLPPILQPARFMFRASNLATHL